MIDQALHEKIEDYLLGKLSAQEAAAFEADIRNDPELAEEVELHRLILPVPDRLAELAFREKFARWRAESEPDPATPLRESAGARWWPAVVLLLLLAGAFGLWWHYDTQLTHEREEHRKTKQALEVERLKSQDLEQENRQLREDLQNALQSKSDTKPVKRPTDTVPGGSPPVAVAPQPDPEWVKMAEEPLYAYAEIMLDGVRDRGAGSQALIARADTAITNKKYREASALLARVPPEDSEYSTSLEMLAFVQFKRKQYAEAAKTFEKYYKEYNKKADWSLCLYYLGDYPRHKAEFKALLGTIIATPGRPMHAKAVALKAEMARRGLW